MKKILMASSLFVLLFTLSSCKIFPFLWAGDYDCTITFAGISNSSCGFTLDNSGKIKSNSSFSGVLKSDGRFIATLASYYQGSIISIAIDAQTSGARTIKGDIKFSYLGIVFNGDFKAERQ